MLNFLLASSATFYFFAAILSLILHIPGSSKDEERVLLVGLFLPEDAVLMETFDGPLVSMLPTPLEDVLGDRRGVANGKDVFHRGHNVVFRRAQTLFANAPDFVGSLVAAVCSPCTCWTAAMTLRSAESGDLFGRVTSSEA